MTDELERDVERARQAGEREFERLKAEQNKIRNLAVYANDGPSPPGRSEEELVGRCEDIYKASELACACGKNCVIVDFDQGGEVIRDKHQDDQERWRLRVQFRSQLKGHVACGKCDYCLYPILGSCPHACSECGCDYCTTHFAFEGFS